MRLVVDVIPTHINDCKFSEYSGRGIYDCKLTGDACVLSYNGECDQLATIADLALLRPQEMNNE